ncbi:Tetratricopeptide TPR_2 repeat-containing protein [Oscillatoria nigro-viridis PCC 7112]|uniref:Tetratricopeptide TPR_2 repeat-containing protein n=3 Tax=Oscillatoriales TaxID=1150 RepID=K9VQ34_9CYAN|nr:tetratricopeptide repeat protein [Oscillatoria nigro-viridis]AFZ10203.1 Tetratricopeptide TPR_2 repeat-containing protein [Oscillatoria nigro-viridis PCC 7112]
MLKHPYLISVFSSVIIASLPLFQTVATAQEEPGCFIIDSSGQVNRLDPLCKRDEQQKLKNIMKAQELYQQGLDLARKGQYKESVELLTQAINLNPSFPEAHMVRADAQTLLENLQGAVEDVQKAIDIYRARGQSQIADMLLVPLNSLQNEIKFNQEDQGQPEVEDEPEGK